MNTSDVQIQKIAEGADTDFWITIATEIGQDLAESGDFPIDLAIDKLREDISIIKMLAFNILDGNICIYEFDDNEFLTNDFIKELEEKENINLNNIVEKGLQAFWSSVSKDIPEFSLENITEDNKEVLIFQKQQHFYYLKVWLKDNLNDDYQRKIHGDDYFDM